MTRTGRYREVNGAARLDGGLPSAMMQVSYSKCKVHPGKRQILGLALRRISFRNVLRFDCHLPIRLIDCRLWQRHPLHLPYRCQPSDLHFHLPRRTAARTIAAAQRSGGATRRAARYMSSADAISTAALSVDRVRWRWVLCIVPIRMP